ncbi:hypothetical protein D9757_007570 [Collybiopsis confluens]|uniref:DNA ligase ATP-dependent N-terminal domain-containing protein n=1 Tax=Collybiopsis confluens TaxID=2823264 RepID=A0A8H5M5V9_9AGAR|nr:hypothetical protein D9757_007570 [Collybiopsis confluens]
MFASNFSAEPVALSPAICSSSFRAKAKVKTPVAQPAGNDASSADEGGDDADDEIEDGLVVKKEVAAASKSALVALSKVTDVDLKGGWKTGEPIPYAALTKAFSMIEATTKQLEKNATLFCSSSFNEVLKRTPCLFFKLSIYALIASVFCNLIATYDLIPWQLSPDYVGVELGIGESLLIKAISESTGQSLATIKADLKKEGDLGLIAMGLAIVDVKPLQLGRVSRMSFGAL